MKTNAHFIKAAVVAGGAMLTTMAAPAVLPQSTADYVEGEALVRFSVWETLDGAQEVVAQHGFEMPQHYDWLSQHEGQVIALLRSTSLNTAELLAELRTEPAVAFAEPNFLRFPTDLRAPNDAKFSLLWGLRNNGQAVNGLNGTPNDDISFLKAWGLARPSTNEIVVGIIDTGIDPTHPDLVSNLWTNPGEIAGNNLDDDGNGYVDDVHGYDFALNTGTLTDSGHHGTHVSGTVGATGNNNVGVIGVDFRTHLMGLKVSSDGNFMADSAIIAAIQYATVMKTRGVNVVALNASYGGDGYNDTERSAMLAAGDAGIVFCAAAGNNAADNDAASFYPASYRLANMIVIAATDQNDALAGFSDYGATTVDLGAPGVNVLSCSPVSQPGYSTYIQLSNSVFSANVIAYSGTTSANGIGGAVYYCGLGNPADFPAVVSNNIALIQRGTLLFSEKVANAMAAGAQAAVIFNDVAGNFNGTLQTASNWIPALSLSQADGQALLAALPANGTVFNFLDPAQIYQLLSGTSMATPHVSGAVAFAAMNFPTDSVPQRIQRLLANVIPLPALAGKTITGGRLNLARIVDADDNGLPDWWELQYFGHLTGTDPNGDPDHDGANNLAEFLAGTDPTNSSSVLRLSGLASGIQDGIKLQWPSAAGRFYRLLSGTNLATGFDTVVQTNLFATPPLNLFTNALKANAKNIFYRLQLEP